MINCNYAITCLLFVCDACLAPTESTTPTENTTPTASTRKETGPGTPMNNLANAVNVLVDNATVNLEEEEFEGAMNHSISELEKDIDDFYSKKMNLLKIIVPVLLSLAFILVLSAAIVGFSACLCDRKKM